jgi:AbrB family looped-hinge helix DNA binding protein
MAEVTVSSKNQIVIPKEAREALGIKPGDKVLITVRPGKIMMMERPAKYHVALKGLLPHGFYGPDYLKEERASWKKRS